MRPLHHREPGPVVALLDAPNVICELVADGVHLHDGMLTFATAIAGPDRAALITDAMAAAGMPDGEYELGGQAVTVADGVARLARDGAIAGSTLTMDAALRHAVDAGIAMADAARMVATTPARAIGLGDRVGALQAGLRADLVVLDDDLNVVRVMRGGPGWSEIRSLGQLRAGTSTPRTACSSGRCTSTSARYDCTAGRHPDVPAGLLGEQPLVLDDLGEDLLRLQLAAQVRGHRPDHRLEDLGEPAVRRLLLVGQVALRPVGVQVVEQLAGLVLLGVQAGEPQQPPGVVAGVDHLRAGPGSARRRPSTWPPRPRRSPAR